MSNNNKNKKWFDKLTNKFKNYLETFNGVDRGGYYEN